MSNPDAPAGLSRPAESKSARMSNSDFRKMMATPRAGDSTSVYASKFATPRKRSDSQAGLSSDQQKKKKSTSAYWKKKKQEKEEETNKVKYRDRAQERRMGKNSDYDDAERELLAGLNAGVGEPSENTSLPNPAASVRGEKTTSEDYFKNLSIEQSKYLGGDEKHTHLVKGLDYALLAKMKSEMAVAEENQKKVEKENVAKSKEGALEFGSASARGVYAALFQKHQKQKSNRFLLGKTTFLFNTSQDRTSAPPMTVIQSIEEGGAEYDDDYFHSPVSQKILEQLKKISAYSKLGEGGKGRKRERRKRTEEDRRREREQEERAAIQRAKEEEERKEKEKKMNEEDSIFGNIGDYVCKIPEKKEDGEKEKEKEKEKGEKVGKVGGYFDGSVFGEMDKEEEKKEDEKMGEEDDEEEEDDEGEEDMKIDDD